MNYNFYNMTEYQYQAEINQLMNIMINNFYSNKDIFLRELISNASDAINKISNKDGKIEIITDKENKVLYIKDNGIGMDKKDLINNIGMIANSGTKNLNNTQLIGYFGVGFYSGFLVSNKIELITKKEETTYKWVSLATDKYTIEEINEDIKGGTVIKCYLKEDCLNYLEYTKLKEIIIKHSQFIKYPIYINDEHINKTKSIWNTSMTELNNDDYISFYIDYYNLIEKPIYNKIIYGEGRINFKGIVYIPLNNMVDMFDKSKMNNVKLYVKNVLITDNCKEICPEWLSFLLGIIETDDIPLNISREMLQYENNVQLLRKMFIKKCIEMFKEIKEDNFELYIDFYTKYGRFIKLGVHDEIDKNAVIKLTQLLVFKSLKTENKYITLDEYIDTLNEIEKEKKIIYYIIGDNYDSILKTPYVEKFIYKDYNVLLMNEPADEYMMETFKEYNEYKFICISNGVIYLNDTEKEKDEYNNKAEEYKELCEYIQKKYDDIFLCSKISLYLISPCTIYGAEYGFSANKEKIIKAQTLLTANKDMNRMMYHKNIEINPNNNVIIKLKQLFDNKEFDKCNIIIELICNTALLHSGYTLKNNDEYVKNIYKLITDGLYILL